MHTCTFRGDSTDTLTFNLSADLGEVRHPFEDFGVSCLFRMRGLQRHGKRGSGEKLKKLILPKMCRVLWTKLLLILIGSC